MIPKLSTLTAMVIASLVTSTDPVLSQAIAKGPFADKYVPRALREIISAEAGANDGFGFPFLLLATYLIRHTPEDDVNFKPDAPRINARSGDVGRLGGDAGKAIETWIVEGWLYFILLGAVIGAVIGIASMSAITFTLRRFVGPNHLFTLTHLLTDQTENGSTPNPSSSTQQPSASSPSASAA
jgi:NhaP-type Na+/H+ or K+/H+ antiporter